MLTLVDHNEADLVLTLDSHIYNTEYVIVKEERVGVHFAAASGILFPSEQSFLSGIFAAILLS